MSSRDWPTWWAWELELTPHLLKRMEDRGFNEVDLRSMLQRARSLNRNVVEGRWVVKTRHADRDWDVIVEPETDSELIVVITAYPTTP